MAEERTLSLKEVRAAIKSFPGKLSGEELEERADLLRRELERYMRLVSPEASEGLSGLISELRQKLEEARP